MGIERAQPQTPPAWDWPSATPEEQGLDAQKLAALVESVRKGELYPHLDALLVVRHRCLVVEEYFQGWQTGRVHTLQSVTKSVTSALVGIAIARGEFKGTG